MNLLEAYNTSIEAFLQHKDLQKILKRAANNIPTNAVYDHEDLMQEALMRLYTIPHRTFSDEDALRAWIYTVAYNAMINYMSINSTDEQDIEGWSAREISLEENAAIPLCEDEEYIIPLQQLSPYHRYLIEQIYFYNKTQQDVADHLGISQQAVSKSFKAAQKNLKKFFPDGCKMTQKNCCIYIEG